MCGSWDKMVPSEARRGTSTKGAAGFLHRSDSARFNPMVAGVFWSPSATAIGELAMG